MRCPSETLSSCHRAHRMMPCPGNGLFSTEYLGVYLPAVESSTCLGTALAWTLVDCTNPLGYLDHLPAHAAAACPSCPASQSAHPRRGGGSLRRRVLSECRVLARLEARPVTRLLGMERQRQGLPSSPWFEPTQGVAGLGQACRACQAGPGRKAAFRDSLFQDSFATTPFPPSRPRCWACATSRACNSQTRPWCDTRPQLSTPSPVSSSSGRLGSGLDPTADDTSCTLLRADAAAPAHTWARWPIPRVVSKPSPRPVRLPRTGAARIPPCRPAYRGKSWNEPCPQHSRAGESGSWSPWGGRVDGALAGRRQRLLSAGRMQHTSCQSIRTHGRLIPRASPKPRLQRQA